MLSIEKHTNDNIMGIVYSFECLVCYKCTSNAIQNHICNSCTEKGYTYNPMPENMGFWEGMKWLWNNKEYKLLDKEIEK